MSVERVKRGHCERYDAKILDDVDPANRVDSEDVFVRHGRAPVRPAGIKHSQAHSSWSGLWC